MSKKKKVKKEVISVSAGKPLEKHKVKESGLSIKTSKVVTRYNQPNVKVNLRVKILKANAYEWYYKHIGKIFRVNLEGYAHYWIVKDGGKRMKPILMDDVKVLKG